MKLYKKELIVNYNALLLFRQYYEKILETQKVNIPKEERAFDRNLLDTQSKIEDAGKLLTKYKRKIIKMS